MPRLKNRSPRMTRNRNTAIVCIDGQTIRLGRWGSAEADEAFRRLIAEWMANGRKLPAATAEDEPTTVIEVCVAYAAHAEKRYTHAKTCAIKSAIRLLRSHYGSEPAASFGPRRLAVLREHMIREQDWSRGYANEACGWIRRAFRYAAAHELVESSVSSRLATLEPLKAGEGGREPKRVTPVPGGDIRRAWPHLPRPVRGLVLIQRLTGARAGEVVGLRATDIDTSGEVWAVELQHHKTASRGKSRTLLFGRRAQKVLRAFMVPGRPIDRPLFDPREAAAQSKRKPGSKGRRPDQKPSPRKTDRTIGEAYTTASYRKAIERACRRAGIVKWTPHMLRHSAATAIRRQFGAEAAATVLGHGSAALTDAIYAERDMNTAKAVIAKVG